MKKSVVILLCLLFSVSVFTQTDTDGFMSKTSSGAAVYTGLQLKNYFSNDALVWKVGGNTVSAHSVFGTNANYDIIFRTNSTERMRILSGGNVGVGLSNPTQKLHVSGNIASTAGNLLIDNNYSLMGRNGANTANLLLASTTPDGYITLANNNMYIDVSTGNLGVGTAYTRGKINVNGSISVGANNMGYNPPANGAIIDGNVGIGTRTEFEKLSIDGRIFLSQMAKTSQKSLYKDALDNLRWGDYRVPKNIYRTITNVSTAPADFNKYYEIGKIDMGSLEGVLKISLLLEGGGCGQSYTYILPMTYAFDWAGYFSLIGSIPSNTWIVIRPQTSSPRHYLPNEDNVQLLANINGNSISLRLRITGSNGASGTPTAYVSLSHSNEFDGVTWTEQTGIGTDATTYNNELPNVLSGINGRTVIQNTLIVSKIGVDGTAPEEKLHVFAGNILLENNYKLRQKNASGVIKNLLKLNYADQVELYENNVTISSSGNVGIGITNPTQKLEVYGNIVTSNFALGNVMNYNRIQTGYGTGQEFRIFNSSNSYAKVGVRSFSIGNMFTDTYAAPSDGLIVQGYTGLGTESPNSKLTIHHSIDNSGIMKISGGLGNAGDKFWLGFLHNQPSGTDANDRARIGVDIVSGGAGRIFFTTGQAGSQVERMRIDESGNIGIGTTTPSVKLDVSGAGNFSSTVTAANATNATHLLNRQTGDSRYGQLLTDNAWYGKNSFGGNNTIEVIALNGLKAYVTSSIAASVSVAANADIVIDKNSGQITTKIGGVRKDYAFGVNSKQTFSTNFTDGNDSCFVNITDTTRILRVTNTSGTTSYARINMPQNPQNDTKLTVLIQGIPSSIDFKILSGVSGQSIITTSHFTPAVGDVFEIWFDSDTEGSSTGKWYIKKL